MTQLNRKSTWWAGIVIGAGALGAATFALHAKPADAATKTLSMSTVDQSVSDPPFGTFLGACSADSDCGDGNTCTSYKKRGSHCTHACQQDSDCGSSSGRCTKLNRCGLREPLKTEP